MCKNCGESDRLERIPSEIFLVKKDNKKELNSSAGEVVKEAISDAQEELKKDQETLRNRRYKK